METNIDEVEYPIMSEHRHPAETFIGILRQLRMGIQGIKWDDTTMNQDTALTIAIRGIDTAVENLSDFLAEEPKRVKGNASVKPPREEG
jgi:hypothetical protein